MPPRLDFVFAGFAGSIILGLIASLLWGEPLGTIATLLGLPAGIGAYKAWPSVLDKLHPFACPRCGSANSRISEEAVAAQDLPLPGSRLDMISYRTLSKQVLVTRTTFRKLRMCAQCGYLQTIKRYTEDTNMHLTWYEQ